MVTVNEPTPGLPILVGVTGHRDILPAALRDVREGTRAALAALRATLGPSLMLMTGLAEGADQMAAEVAVELGIRIIAVAPMPMARYRGTMETEAGATALDRLWANDLVSQRIELPLVGSGTDPQQDVVQYEQLGLVLSRQSHILLALWNGYDAEPREGRPSPERQTRGGSAHVVAMRQVGERQEVMPSTIRDGRLFSGPPPMLELARSGPILHVVTPRAKDGGAMCQDAAGHARSPGALVWWSDLTEKWPRRRRAWLLATLWPREAEKEPARATGPLWHAVTPAELPAHIPVAFRRIREAGERLARRAVRMAPGASYLCPDEDMARERDIHPLRQLRRLFDIADADASHIQTRLFGTWLPGLPWPKGSPIRIGHLLWFAVALPVATLSFEVFAEFKTLVVFLAVYIGVLLASLIFYLLRVARPRLQGRYQDHRALAEGLRVQFFWAASGMPVAVSDNYLRNQTGTLGWIRLALRGPALDGLAAGLAIDGPDDAFVRKRWIKDQMTYFRRQGAWQESAHVAMQRLTRLSAGSLIVVAAVLLGLSIVKLGHPEAVPEAAIAFLSVLLGILPAVAAFFVIIAEGRAYEEHAHAYAQAQDVFAEAERQALALKADDSAGWRDLLLALGQEALAESATWIHTHRGAVPSPASSTERGHAVSRPMRRRHSRRCGLRAMNASAACSVAGRRSPRAARLASTSWRRACRVGMGAPVPRHRAIVRESAASAFWHQSSSRTASGQGAVSIDTPVAATRKVWPVARTTSVSSPPARKNTEARRGLPRGPSTQRSGRIGTAARPACAASAARSMSAINRA